MRRIFLTCMCLCLGLSGCGFTVAQRQQAVAHLVAAQVQIQLHPDYQQCREEPVSGAIGRLCVAWTEISAARDQLER